MRIHRLTVRNFRGVADRTIELPETGTTVIVGDNEVGKSSLVEALVLLFDLADDSKAARVRNVQPFGSDVAPEVEAELTLGGHRLVYGKRWLRTRSTELTVTSPTGSKKQSFTGREAHNEADRLFRTYVDPVLWQTSLVGQGESLLQPAPADAEPLIAAVTAESGTPADGASMPLVAAVEQEYLRYWTKGGRPTNDFARATDDLAAAEAQAEGARQAMDAVAADIRHAERLSQDLADIRGRLDDQVAAVDELERDSRLGEALLARRDAVVQKADTANARLENRTAARSERDRLVAEVERRTTSVAELRERVAGLEPAGAAHETARGDAQRLLTEAVERRDERRTALHDAERRLAALRDHAELARLTERRAEVEAVRKRIATTRAVLESCRVTDELLTALEEARAAVVVAEAALQAGAPQVVVRRLGGEAPVQVSDDATLFGSELTGTEEVKQRVSGELHVVVPGQVEVVVRAGGSVAGLRKAVDAAVRAEKQLLADAGARDLAAAREQVRRRDVAAAELAESRRTEASLVAAGDPAERIAVLSARLTGPAPDGDIPAAQAAVDELRGALTADEVAVTDAEFAAEQARKAADDDRAAVVRAHAQLEVELDRLAGAERALADARAAASDDAVLAAETEATSTVEAVIEELAALQSQVDDQGADELPVRLAEARQVLAQIRAEHDELRDDLRTTEGRLQQSGTDGLATRLDTAEAALDRCRFSYDLLRRRADAARRVRETLARHRTEAQNRYAEPLRSRIETLGRTVYGQTFTVALDDDLAVSERELNGVRLPVEELSTGAREQLAIITRLAISHLVGTGEGSVPAIFDDALGWSDKGRLREMGALLGRAGEHGQVIVLTCVPERYEYIPGRNVIRLNG